MKYLTHSKIILTLFTAWLVSARVVLAQNAPAEPKAPQNNVVQLFARTGATNFAAGSRIELELVITNGSSHPFDFSFSNITPTDYEFQIIGTDKQQAPLTRLGNSFQRGTYISMHSMQLKPADTYTNIVILSQIYDLTIPQEYEVNVRRGALHSNPVRISVKIR